jgi:hypothetical protein
MSSNRRRRPKGGAQRGQGANRSGRRNANRGGRSGGGQPQPSSAAFWGSPEALPEARADVHITPEPAAVPRSLGTPPLAGQEAVADYYFAAVYDRAVMLGGALAAAGGLLEPAELQRDAE